MNQFNYPLYFKFKIGTIANDFVGKDSLGRTLFYVREKIFAWKDLIKVYSDETKSELLYQIKSNRVIDFQQTFTISDSNSRIIGKVRRRSIQSLWKSTFKLMDENDNHDFKIKEKNAFTKFWDALFGEIPIIGFFSGYIFNPSYILESIDGNELFHIIKEPSFFGRKFRIEKLSPEEFDEERFVLSIVLMILNERSRG